METCHYPGQVDSLKKKQKLTKLGDLQKSQIFLKLVVPKTMTSLGQ